MKFLTKCSIPPLSLQLHLLPFSPCLGLSQFPFDAEPLPIQFLLPEIPVPDDCMSHSLTSFQFLFKCHVLSQNLKLHLIPTCFLLLFCTFFSTASFAVLLAVFPILTYKLREGKGFCFHSLVYSRAVTHTWQEISK